MKNILNYSTTEEFQDHEVETGNTGMVRISKLGVVNMLSNPNTSDKGIIWRNIEDISNFHGDGWYETTGLEYPFLTLGNKYNVNLTPLKGFTITRITPIRKILKYWKEDLIMRQNSAEQRTMEPTGHGASMSLWKELPPQETTPGK